MTRASKIQNPIGSLTPEEKERLGWLVMWAIDGPEQGFIDRQGTYSVRIELAQFLHKNGIATGGMWLEEAKRNIDPQRPRAL